MFARGCLAVLVLVSIGSAQKPELVHEFDADSRTNSSQPRGFITAESRVRHTLHDWDERFVKHGPWVYIRAHSAHGENLWRTLGTPTTTVRVTNLARWSASEPRALTARTSDELLFLVTVGTRVALMKTNGTPTGTSLVRELQTEHRDTRLARGVAFGQKPARVAFVVKSDLWVTDGTRNGTVSLAKNVHWSSKMIASPDGARLYFESISSTNGGLWSTDGTVTGTKRVHGIRPQSHFIHLGRLTLFSGRTTQHGRELWKTDGTTKGTSLVKDIAPGAWDGAYLRATARLGRFVIFGGSDGQSSDPWRTDGTAAGTQRIARNPKNRGFNWNSEAVTGSGRVWFTTWGSTGKHLHVTDGTRNGTKTFMPYWEIDRLRVDQQKNVLFFRWHKYENVELCRVTKTGLEILDPDLPWRTNVCESLPGRYVYKATIGKRPDTELRVYDSRTKSSTDIDVYPGQSSAGVQLEELARVPGGWIVRIANRGIFALDVRTKKLRTLSNHERNGQLVRLGKWVLFVSSTAGRLYSTDGTGPYPVGRFTGVWPPLTKVGDRIAFIRYGSNGNRETWLTDGSFAGTTLLESHPSKSRPQGNWGFATLPSSRELVFFREKTEVWRSHGSPTTTRRAFSLPNNVSATSAMTRAANALVFSATDRHAGDELWRTDGTAKGTYRLADIAPGLASSRPRGFVDVGPFTLFRAEDKDGSELWRTDGTSTGTRKVRDIHPGAPGSHPRHIVRIGYGEAMFAGYWPNAATELIRTDGTASGTRLVHDLNVVHGSEPRALVYDRGHVYFSADDGNAGREMWRVSVGAASTLTGVGCGRHDALFELDASAPRIGQKLVTIADNALPRTPAALFVGVPATHPTHLPHGCYATWDSRHPTWIAHAWSQSKPGAHRASFAIANDTRLLGLRFTLQAINITARLPGGFALSNGVTCVVGR